jgi:hypothetical protein
MIILFTPDTVTSFIDLMPPISESLRYDGSVNHGFWGGKSAGPQGQILFGRLGEENPKHPGTYQFSSSTGLVVNDAHITTPDADTDGNGENTRPRAGAYCLAVMTTDGAGCYVIGFLNQPKFDENKGGTPVVGNPDDNNSSGDKSYKTAGGASFILKRGGAVVIEGGPGVGVILNPLNNTMTLRAANVRQIADGYQAIRGRQDLGTTNPATIHGEDFLHQVGPVFDRFRVSHGSLDGGARRKLELASVTVAGTQEIAIPKTRETYQSDGSWMGEGPKYQWGGTLANEAMVLGNQLVTAMGELIDIISGLKVNTAWGPSTPPLPDTLSKLEQLKGELGERILSTYLYITKLQAALI